MYTEQQFTIPKLNGISQKSVEEHIKLYSGYVKNANLIEERIKALSKESEKNAYELAELQRRFAFEFGGMRNHEYYFKLLEKSVAPDPESGLFKAIEARWGSFDAWKARFTDLALTRGVGWAILYWDRSAKALVHGWVDEQHLGQLVGCIPVITLDMWEHSYVLDYFPSGKKQYIADFLSQMDWKQAEENFVVAKSIE